MEHRFKSDKMQELGELLIQKHPYLKDLRDNEVRIVYLASDQAKTKGTNMVYGSCEKIQPKNKWAIDADFAVVFYTPNMDYMNETQLEILMLHELMHIGVNVDKAGKKSWYIISHDLEDFREIIEQYGPDWAASPYQQMTLDEVEQ